MRNYQESDQPQRRTSTASLSLDDLLRRNSLLTRLAIELRASHDASTIVTQTLWSLHAGLDLTSISVLLSSKEGSADLAIQMHNGEISLIGREQANYILSSDLVKIVLCQSHTLVIADVGRDPRWLKLTTYQPAGSAMLLPIRQSSGETLGALVVHHVRTHIFTSHDLLLLEGVAAQLGLALSRVQSSLLATRLHNDMQALTALVDERTEQLARLGESLRVIIDHLPYGALLLNEEGVVLAANVILCSVILERRPQAVIGQRYTSIWQELAKRPGLQVDPPWGWADATPGVDRSRPMRLCVWWKNSNGRIFSYNVTRTPLARAGNPPLCWLELWSDGSDL